MLLRFLETVTLLLCAIHIPRTLHLLHLKSDSDTILSYNDQTMQSVVESFAVVRLTVGCIVLTVLFIFFLWLSRNRWKLADPATGKMRLELDFLKWFVLGCAVLGLGGAIYYIYLNKIGKLPESLTSSNSLVDLNQYNALGWRWRIWNTTLIYYTEEWHRHPLRLFLGLGPDSLYQLMMGEHQGELQALSKLTTGSTDLYLTNAHNEWLTMWIDQGLFGVFLYLGFFIIVFLLLARHFRAADLIVEGETLKQVLRAATCLAIAAYFAHNFFSYQQISAAPQIFLVMGLAMAGEFVERKLSMDGR